VAEQYEPERVVRANVQSILRKVSVAARYRYTRRYPDEMPRDGAIARRSPAGAGQARLRGLPDGPQSWATVEPKFERLAAPFTSAPLRRELVAAIARLEDMTVRA
jgi:2-methylcitrate dehydratase